MLNVVDYSTYSLWLYYTCPSCGYTVEASPEEVQTFGGAICDGCQARVNFRKFRDIQIVPAYTDSLQSLKEKEVIKLPIGVDLDSMIAALTNLGLKKSEAKLRLNAVLNCDNLVDKTEEEILKEVIKTI